MSPYLYILLITGEVDEEDVMMGVFREMRVYGIVFNLHHANFTKLEDEMKVAKRKVEKIVK